MVENGAKGEVMQYLCFDDIMDPGNCRQILSKTRQLNLRVIFALLKMNIGISFYWTRMGVRLNLKKWVI